MNIGNWQKATKIAFGFAAALALSACSSEAAVDAPAATTGEFADGELAIPVMGEQVNIVAFGDSLFAGYGLDNPADSYPAKLQAALRARGTNASITNAGVSGDTSAAGLSRLAFVLDNLDAKPDLFILELGGNDLLRNIQPSETRSNFVSMLTILRDRDIPVLLMGMRSPPNYGAAYQAEFDAIYADLAQEFDVDLIPFWLEEIYQEPSLFQSDRIHPTAEGIEELVSSTVDDIAAVLPEDGEQGEEG